MTYLHDGQLFEWESEKTSVNVAKHKITFEAACEVFLDPFVRLVDASGESEAREAAIGMTEDWSVLFVGPRHATKVSHSHRLGERGNGRRKEDL